MAYRLLVFDLVFGTQHVVRGLFHTSNYRVLNDSMGGFTYFAAKCTGKLNFEILNQAFDLLNIYIQLESIHMYSCNTNKC